MHQPEPSRAELEILCILWRSQPCTVKAIHEALAETRTVGYTTVLKQLQRMEEKGLVVRKKGAARAHLYRAADDSRDVRKSAVERLLNVAFDGSVAKLVSHALGDRKIPADEVDEIRRLVDRITKDDEQERKP